MRLPRPSLLRRFSIPSLPSLPWIGAGQGGDRPLSRKLPLPITAAVTAVLLALPLTALQRLPRPRAQGLEQLLDGVTLLQSFPAAPQRAVPQLWRQRLGGQAERAWREQRGFWWQLWGEHVNGAPMLALPAASLLPSTVASLPPQAMRLGDLVVVAPDPLAMQMLRDGLRPQQRRSRGLQRRCLDRLRSSQAVFWNSAAIGVIAGPMAPLLQRFQDGCLSIGLDASGVVWSGEAAPVDGALRSAPTSPQRIEPPRHRPLPADQLLQIQGASLDLLLQGLLSRQMIRDPLASRYGIDTDRLALLRKAPFQLRLRPLPQGPFQASLELQLVTGNDRAAWQRLLDHLGRSLQEQGLRQADPAAAKGEAATGQPPAMGPAARPAAGATPPESTTAQGPNPAAPTPISPPPGPHRSAPLGPPAHSPSPTSPTASPAAPGVVIGANKLPPITLPAATWRRADGVVVGGWRWLPNARGQDQLLLFLGPVPQAPMLPIGAADQPLPAPGGLLLRSRPSALASLEMLPPEVPELVRRSSQLEMEAQQTGSGPLPLSWLSGRLQVSR